MKIETTRRDFFATVAGTCLASSSVRGAMDRIRVGVIGCGVRGKYLIGNLPAFVQVAAVCDCAQSRIAETMEPRAAFVEVLRHFKDHDASSTAVFQDYRRLLDDGSLDAVIIATPDHHHVPIASLACQAGYDVYLEKPLSLKLNEGRSLVEIAQREGRVVQVGSQQRSMAMNVIGCEFVRNGGLGKIRSVELPAYPGPMMLSELDRFPLPQRSSATIPTADSVDWKMFLGDTDPVAYDPRIWMKEDFEIDGLLWRGWDLFQNYSGHLMTNWGSHSVDMVQLALGRDRTGPIHVRAYRPESISAAARFWALKTPPLRTDARNNADERRFWQVEMRYADGVQLQFVSGIDSVTFFGERGTMTMRRNFFSVDPPSLLPNPPNPHIGEAWEGDGNVARPHLENWLNCIQTRTSPVAPLEAGHRTVTICQLANLARRSVRDLHWDPDSEKLTQAPIGAS